MRRLAQVALVWLMLESTASAGPWTKNLGEAYVKLSESVFLAGNFVDPRANRVEGVTNDVAHRSFTTALYAEVGVFDRLHLQVYLPYTAALNSYEGTARYLSLGLGDLIAAIQWSPDLLPFPHAIRADIKVPLYDIADPKGFEGVRFPAPGDGQVDATLWLSAGASFNPIYLYGEIGHRFRTELYVGEGDDFRFSDSFVFFGQLGWNTPITLVAAANLNVVVPYAFDEASKGYVNLGGSLFLPLGENFALEASFDGTLWARASSRGVSIAGGISYRM
jgi:hypothetical protein